jgi:3-deoxy-D-manno-octulosonate 8-phosphate phosphatase (KDO 8-P phosphatase)
VTDLAAKCRSIELLLSDVDGVMTDGRIIYDNQGIETKRFHVRDGVAVKLWQKSGNQFGIITQRSSHAVKIRASELDVSLVRQERLRRLSCSTRSWRSWAWNSAKCAISETICPILPVIRAVGTGRGGSRRGSGSTSGGRFHHFPARRSGGRSRDSRNDSPKSTAMGRPCAIL